MRASKGDYFFISRWIKPAVQFLRAGGFFQKRCHYCLEPFDADDSYAMLCQACQKELAPYSGNKCLFCGEPLDSGEKLCSNCRKQKPPWTKTAYHGLYAGELRKMLLSFKFGGKLHLAKVFADFIMNASVCLPKADLLLPVPQHPAHLLKRGFNQANELCKRFSAISGIPCSARMLLKTRKTAPQEGLSAMGRKENIKDAFVASPKVKSRDIWLIDDVLTTGSTCAECCSALRKAGAASVSLLFVARTPLGDF